MHSQSSALPSVMEGPGTEWRVAFGLEGLAAGFAKLPRGADFTPMLKGLPGHLCQCPHWGYLVEGKMTVQYEDKSVETITGGEIYYLPPGHTAWIDEDTKLVDFSPEDELRRLVEHVTGQH